jgi:hypothetical protein
LLRCGISGRWQISDCARLLVAKPFQREDVAFSSSNWIGTSEFDPFRSSIHRAA